MTEPELISAWLEETDEQLQLLSQVVTRWTDERSNENHATEALRLIHAMEGAAGALKFDNLLAATRFLGNEVEQVRNDTSTNPSKRLDALITFLQDCNNHIRQGEPLPSAPELIEKMKALRTHT